MKAAMSGHLQSLGFEKLGEFQTCRENMTLNIHQKENKGGRGVVSLSIFQEAQDIEQLRVSEMKERQKRNWFA